MVGLFRDGGLFKNFRYTKMWISFFNLGLCQKKEEGCPSNCYNWWQEINGEAFCISLYIFKGWFWYVAFQWVFPGRGELIKFCKWRATQASKTYLTLYQFIKKCIPDLIPIFHFSNTKILKLRLFLIPKDQNRENRHRPYTKIVKIETVPYTKITKINTILGGMSPVPKFYIVNPPVGSCLEDLWHMKTGIFIQI